MTILVEALLETARRLQQAAEAQRLQHVNERDHLDPQFRIALAAVARSSASTYRLTKPKVATAEWPKLGTVDVGIEVDDRGLTLIELKCGKGEDALGPCAWDAAELAYLLQARTGNDAFLVAATTLGNWEASIRGAEFFRSARHDMAALRGSYADWWEKWERDGYPAASRMPARFETELVAETPFTVAAETWLLRMSRVRAIGAARIDWPRLLPTSAVQGGARPAKDP